MMLSTWRQALLYAASTAGADAAGPSVPVVVVTGLVLVFAILVLLYVILLIEGKIFAGIDKRKKEKEQAKQLAETPEPPQPATVAPAVEAGIPPEVVAAIAAAIEASTGGAYALRSVSTSKKGRGAWGLAGVIQSTEPF